MGTDIHSIVQYRANGKTNQWTTVRARFGDDRNYDTFAVLANVRNGSGFAGMESGEAWPAISEPRGFPKDMVDGEFPQVSDSMTRCPHCCSDEMWLGDHSHSWVTLAEMKSMAAKLRDKRFYMVTGVVTLDQYEDYVRAAKVPENWSGGVMGQGLRTIDEMDVEGRTVGDLRRDKVTHIRMRWPRKIEECITSLFKYIDLLETVKIEFDWSDRHRPTDDDVRLVFGFDS